MLASQACFCFRAITSFRLLLTVTAFPAASLRSLRRCASCGNFVAWSADGLVSTADHCLSFEKRVDQEKKGKGRAQAAYIQLRVRRGEATEATASPTKRSAVRCLSNRPVAGNSQGRCQTQISSLALITQGMFIDQFFDKLLSQVFMRLDPVHRQREHQIKGH